MAALNLNKVFAKIEALGDRISNREAKIGWFPAAQYEDGTPVAYVAAIQEFGSPENAIPPRPFMRPTVQDKQGEWVDHIAAGMRKVIRSDTLTTDDVLGAVGDLAAADIAKTIASANFTPLSKITLMLRKMKDEHKGDANWRVTGAIVGEAARRVAAGEPGSDRTSPLDDTGLMLATLTSQVGDAS